MGSGAEREGDLVAERFEVSDVDVLGAFGTHPGLVVVGPEIVEVRPEPVLPQAAGGG